MEPTILNEHGEELEGEAEGYLVSTAMFSFRSTILPFTIMAQSFLMKVFQYSYSSVFVYYVVLGPAGVQATLAWYYAYCVWKPRAV